MDNNYYPNNQTPQQPQYQAPQYQAPQPQYQQPQYQAPQPQTVVYNQFGDDPAKKVVGIGEWIVLFLVSCIPLVNVIMWIVWLVSGNTPKSKKNYIIASIIWGVICGVLAGIIAGIMAAAGVSMADYMY